MINNHLTTSSNHITVVSQYFPRVPGIDLWHPWRIVIGGQGPKPHGDAFGGFALGFHQRWRALTHLRYIYTYIYIIIYIYIHSLHITLITYYILHITLHKYII